MLSPVDLSSIRNVRGLGGIPLKLLSLSCEVSILTCVHVMHLRPSSVCGVGYLMSKHYCYEFEC